MKIRSLITVIAIAVLFNEIAIQALAATPTLKAKPTPLATNNSTPSLQAQLAPVASTPTPAPTAQAAPSLIPPAPDLDAAGYVLMDANSGKIIAAKNSDQRLAPASLTKLMTLYLTEQALANNVIHLTDNVKISDVAWQTGGSRMFIQVGSIVPLQQLIEGVIVDSGNDATMALAQYVGGSIPTFVQMMNTQAQHLGMNNTHFADPTGLPADNHYSTPYDLATLTRAIIQDYPQYYHFFGEKWLDYNHIKQPNRNRLLWRDASVDGLKTGHTDAAGYCLITSAKRNGMRLIAVVMGTPTDSARANDSEALLNYGFRFYTTRKLFTANTSIKKERVWLGENDYVDMGTSQDIYVTVPTTMANKLNVTLALNTQELKAPIIKGQSYGSLNITADNTAIQQIPLVALQNDPAASFFTKVWGHIALRFHHWFS